MSSRKRGNLDQETDTYRGKTVERLGESTVQSEDWAMGLPVSRRVPRIASHHQQLEEGRILLSRLQRVMALVRSTNHPTELQKLGGELLPYMFQQDHQAILMCLMLENLPECRFSVPHSWNVAPSIHENRVRTTGTVVRTQLTKNHTV